MRIPLPFKPAPSAKGRMFFPKGAQTILMSINGSKVYRPYYIKPPVENEIKGKLQRKAARRLRVAAMKAAKENR